MIKHIDNLLERLTHDADTVQNVVDIEFKNTYKYDKNFIYEIVKENKEVIVMYKGIKFGFTLPIIEVPLRPIVSWLFFFRRNYVHQVIDTYKLQYSLSMYYIVCLQTYYKNNLNINLKPKIND